MNLRALLLVVRKHRVIVTIPLVVGLLLAIAYVTVTPKSFQSTSKLFVSTTGSANVSDLSAGSLLAQQVVASYATLASTDYVLDRVSDELHLTGSRDALTNQLTATVEQSTSVIDLTVTDRSPARAAAIANSVAGQMSGAVDRLTPTSGTAASPIRITQVQTARAAQLPIAPSVSIDIAAGLLLGLVAGFLGAALRELLDTRIRTAAEMEQVVGRPTLGEIPFERALRRQPLMVDDRATAAAADAFRLLRTNLRFLGPSGRLRAIVSSALPGEGKSTVTANLAVALASAGRRVITVDGDLHRPRLGAYFGLDEGVGLTDVLIGEVEWRSAVQAARGGLLDVLPAGALPPNPGDLLQSQAMADLIDQLSKQYDVVLVDAPPLLAVADTSALSAAVGQVLLVGSVRTLRRPELVRSLAVVEHAGGRVIGVVASMVRPGRRASKAYRQYVRPRTARSRSAKSTTAASAADRARLAQNRA